MQFPFILTSFALLGAMSLSWAPSVQAQASTNARASADETILEMHRAYKRSDSKRMGALLPQLKGHPLEPWAAYWELAARLDGAPANEIQDFLARYAGSYQEDRLRADWLSLLGKRREWPTFNQEYPKYRMNDDRSLRCYALLNEFSATGADVAQQIEAGWLAQKDADDGCAHAAEQQLQAGKLKPHSVWLRARLGLENDRLKVAAQAVALLGKDLRGPERYLQRPGQIPHHQVHSAASSHQGNGHTGADTAGDGGRRRCRQGSRQTALEDPAHRRGAQLGMGRDRQACGAAPVQ
jgi:soluble lytic murein transglycosylase